MDAKEILASKYEQYCNRNKAPVSFENWIINNLLRGKTDFFTGEEREEVYGDIKDEYKDRIDDQVSTKPKSL